MHSSEPAVFQPVTWHEMGRSSDEAVWAAVDQAMRRAAGGGGVAGGRRVTVGGATFNAHIVQSDTRNPAQPVLVLLYPEGQMRLPPAAVLQQTFHLTPRESEVALLLAERKSNKEIARELDVTLFTAERHTERILGKLGIGSRRHVRAALLNAR